jgi:hypothetical protein
MDFEGVEGVKVVPVSAMGGKPASSRANFLTRESSRTPPQQVSSVFQSTKRSCDKDKQTEEILLQCLLTFLIG